MKTATLDRRSRRDAVLAEIEEAERERYRSLKEARRAAERAVIRQQADADHAEADRRRARIERAVEAGMDTLPARRFHRFGGAEVRAAVAAAVRAVI